MAWTVSITEELVTTNIVLPDYDSNSCEAAEVTIYPQYSDDGGVESERTYIRQLVQKYVNDGTDEDLFNSEEIEEENSDVRM
mgnify:CR=1 FL=1